MEFEGSNYFRFRLALSLISGKTITIKNIRKKKKNIYENEYEYSHKQEIEQEHEGLYEYEAKLLKLIDKLCDDTIITINEDGTELYFKPGFLIGNVKEEVRISDLNISFNCGKERSITYFIEFLLMVIPFFKNPVKLLLKGITDDNVDRTIYTCKIISEHFFKNVLKLDDFLSINILKRGIKSNALNGEVLFFMNNIKTINPFDISDAGLVQKITGSILCNNMSLVFQNKLMNFTKKYLHNFITYINFEIEKPKNSKYNNGKITNHTNSNNYNSKVNNNTNQEENHFISFSIFAHTKNNCIYGTDICLDTNMLNHVNDLILTTNTINNNSFMHIKPEQIRMNEIISLHNKNPNEQKQTNKNIKYKKNVQELNIKNVYEDDINKLCSVSSKKDIKEVNTNNCNVYNDNVNNDNVNNDNVYNDNVNNDNVYNDNVNYGSLNKTQDILHKADICERLGFFVALNILNEIKGLPSIDTNYQWLPILFMALSNDIAVSTICLKTLTPYSIALIRLLRDFFNVVFDIKKVKISQIDYSYTIKCVGINYGSFSKKTF
ncbi:RNA 3'-terminal phosphate cyclase-like protein, putative [Hepatocystis sp. ex Piliocolobus tephrosceles]|nr:RNA 3'-terminal phosphate cyclase-like protein, putative [Hepatocystis sp. ex Piliocolobus tephrosceles]